MYMYMYVGDRIYVKLTCNNWPYFKLEVFSQERNKVEF